MLWRPGRACAIQSPDVPRDQTINYSKNIALVTVAMLGVAALAGGAQAADPVAVVNNRAVHFADLNINTAAGAQVLYQRIRGAAQSVCGDVGSRQLDEAAAAKACVDRAIVSSVRSVGSVELTRTANAHGYAVETSLKVASAR